MNDYLVLDELTPSSIYLPFVETFIINCHETSFSESFINLDHKLASKTAFVFCVKEDFQLKINRKLERPLEFKASKN